MTWETLFDGINTVLSDAAFMSSQQIAQRDVAAVTAGFALVREEGCHGIGFDAPSQSLLCAGESFVSMAALSAQSGW